MRCANICRDLPHPVFAALTLRLGGAPGGAAARRPAPFYSAAILLGPTQRHATPERRFYNWPSCPGPVLRGATPRIKYPLPTSPRPPPLPPSVSLEPPALSAILSIPLLVGSALVQKVRFFILPHFHTLHKCHQFISEKGRHCRRLPGQARPAAMAPLECFSRRASFISLPFNGIKFQLQHSMRVSMSIK